MNDNTQNDLIINQLIKWGENRDTIRAMIMTSTRTKPGSPIDIFSDYDVILLTTDIHPFYEDRSWLENFGRVLVLYKNPINIYFDCEQFAYITQYENGLKIDFTLSPVELLRRIVAEPQLPEELDVGYTILLDKDNLTEGLKPPTYRAFIPSPPSEAEYFSAMT
jgi:aminoglycoside 6-adenylyltransferase